TEDIEIHIESLATKELEVVTVSLKGLPVRKNYSVRLQVKVLFLDEKTCQISLKDIGFGEMFRETDFQIEKMIHLGGSNGQFNSLS
ncbi:MAG: DUF5716 family protein, partial [Lachnospiraceae bacterium]